MVKRRRGTAIYESDKGILLTRMGKGPYLLPGGGADKHESRFRAAIRELEEETGLLAHSARIIFRHESHSHRHTVVLVKARGTPRPLAEVKKIVFYRKGKNIRMSTGTRDIINKYLEWKDEQISD